MKRFTHILLVFLSALSTISLNAQSHIALWNYNAIVGAPTAPVADLGAGTSSIVGSLVVGSAATGMDPIINNGCGSQNGLNPGAWAFTASPGLTNESNGVQYNVSTVGFQNIFFTWDQRSSNTAVNTMRVKYTLDGTTWTDFVMTDQNTTYCNGVLDGGRFQNSAVGDNYRRVSVNFTSITGANNNANFAVRVLAAHYQTSGEFRQTGVPTSIATAGTWRFDNVSIGGRSNVSIIAANNFISVNENVGTVVVPITVSNANANPIVLNLGFSTYSNATENSDFTWSNTVTIPANTNGVFNHTITVVDDALAEKAERIIVKMNSGSNALVSTTDNYRIIFIADNDAQMPVQSNELAMTLLSSYSNGATGTNSAEIVTFDPEVDRMYIANSIGAKLDIVNFANPSNPVLISSIPMGTYGNINSIVAHDSIIALAIENSNPQLNGSVVFLDYNGNFLKQVTVGAMPDMITFNKNYTKVLTANEGEPNTTYTVDPEGSVSIIDISGGISSLTQANVTTLGLTAYNTQSSTLIAQGIRLFPTSATVAQDLEPEYIAVSDDNTKAYVSIQEANALLTIDLTTNSIVSLSALGYSQYNTGSGNALDASDQTVCFGTMITLTAFGGTTYNWNNSVTNSVPFSANATQSYTVTGLGSNGCSNNDQVNITVLPVPIINLGINQTVCLGESVTLSGSGANSYSWNNGVVNASAFIPLVTQIYTCVGVDVNGCQNTNQVTVVVNPLPIVNAGLDQSICDGDSIILLATGATNYTWNNGVTNSVAFSPITTQTYTVSGIDLNNCSNSDQIVITVNPLPIVNAGIDQTTCVGTAVVLNATGANSLSWNNGVINGLYFTPSATQTYQVTGVDANNCSNSDIVQINVNSLPTISAGNDQTICPGVSVILSATGGINYQWNNGVTNGNSFIPNVTQSYIASGSDNNGCTNSDTVIVTVIDCTGLEEQDGLNVSVYPNPIQDLLYFEFNEVISGGIELLSVEGRLISFVEINELETYQMDLSTLSFGPYFIRMNLNGQVKSLKVIKAN